MHSYHLTSSPDNGLGPGIGSVAVVATVVAVGPVGPVEVVLEVAGAVEVEVEAAVEAEDRGFPPLPRPATPPPRPCDVIEV